nr:hypothetical protein [Wenjunlia tyrosinilytica]
MRVFVAGHEARDESEFLELALGTPPELWLGEPDETEEERAARLDAARDILADDPTLFDRVTKVAAQAIESHAPELLPAPLPLGVSPRRGRYVPRSGVAA